MCLEITYVTNKDTTGLFFAGRFIQAGMRPGKPAALPRGRYFLEAGNHRHRVAKESLHRLQLSPGGRRDRGGALHRHLEPEQAAQALRVREYRARQRHNQIRQH